jgi:hypothetical protein
VSAQAGLARVALASGAADAAYRYVDDILRYADDDPDLHDAGDSMAIYLTCYQVLKAMDDPTADDLLRRAYARLGQWAERIEDTALRRSFLESVPSHCAIVEAYEQLPHSAIRSPS